MAGMSSVSSNNRRERQILLTCWSCGQVEISDDEYMRQLMRANATWRCPDCGQQASWYGIIEPCVYEGCDGMLNTEQGEDECPECGRSQEEWWYNRQEEAETETGETGEEG